MPDLKPSALINPNILVDDQVTFIFLFWEFNTICNQLVCRIAIYGICFLAYVELNLLSYSIVVVVIDILTFNTFGVWLSPPRFSFQSFEQKSLKRIYTTIANSKSPIIINLWPFVSLFFIKGLTVIPKRLTFGLAPLTNPNALTLLAPKILRKHHIVYQVCFVYYPLPRVRSLWDSHSLPRRPMPLWFYFKFIMLNSLLNLHVLDKLVHWFF